MKKSATNIYDELGIRTIINCQGNRTAIGGSCPSEQVLAAIDATSRDYVVMSELMKKSCEFVAGLLGVEAAYITSGCAAACALSAAACMVGKDPEKIGRLPNSTGLKNKVLIQKKQRYVYDRAFEISGAVLVNVGDENGCSAMQLNNAIGPETAAVAYLAGPHDETVVSLEKTVEIAHAKGVPVIVDAAAQVYPLDYFLATARSADLVCFGGKFFGAPQATGFVCGKKELVSAVAEHGFVAFPNQKDGQRGFGRTMKVDRQSIIGMVEALRIWLTMDHEARLAQIDEKLAFIQGRLNGIPLVRTKIVNVGHYWGNDLHVTIDSKVLGKTVDGIARELDEGEPRIWIGLGAGGFFGFEYQHNPRLPVDTFAVNVIALKEGDEKIVARRLRDVLSG